MEITITHDWKKEKTDLSKCVGCEEVIYSGMYRLHLCVEAGQKTEERTPYCVCESCFEIIGENKWKL